jgi:putative SOS response-associated peptidase YedK
MLSSGLLLFWYSVQRITPGGETGMCGRVIQYRRPEEYAASLGVSCPEGSISETPTRFNGAPGQNFLIICRGADTTQPVFSVLNWGLIPSGADDPKIALKLANARAETVVTEDVFRAAYRYRRCLIPVDGFYEWKKLWPVGKQPHAVGMTEGQPFTLAGLWEQWKNPDGEWLRTFTIITIQSNKFLADLSHRMPLIIEPRDRERWMSEEAHPGDLLKPSPSEGMTKWLVSTQVNSLKNNDRGLLEPLPIAS